MSDQQKGWIGVDLDGTLAEYGEWKGRTHIGDPITLMQNRVKEWIKNGVDVRIFTARYNPESPDNDKVVKAIKAWCKEYLGKELPVTATKDYLMIELWDDRAVQVAPNTGVRVDSVSNDMKKYLST